MISDNLITTKIDKLPTMSASSARGLILAFKRPLSTSTRVMASKAASVEKSIKYDPDLVLETRQNGVTTITMNNPDKLNGWTLPMMAAVKDSFRRLAKDEVNWGD